MMESKYREIYNSITASNIKSLSSRYGVHERILLTILNQKIVRDVRRRSSEFKKNSQTIKERWDNGEEILSIAKELNFPPALVCSMILKEQGFSDQGKKRVLRDPSRIENNRLRSEIIKALKFDTVYSPVAHKMQMSMGKLGESILSDWFREKKIDFKSEEESKGANTKTPDFILREAIKIDGHSIKWVESKVGFGDVELHKYYFEKQYSSYLEKYGRGMVVYWYGFLEIIKEFEPRLFVVDYTFFPKFFTKRLFE